MKTKILRKPICMIIALAFAAGCTIPAMPEVSFAYERDQGWVSEIPQMLQNGEYEEGAVVVCVAPSASGQTAKGGKSQENSPGSGLLEEAEEIMRVDTSVAETAAAMDPAAASAGSAEAQEEAGRAEERPALSSGTGASSARASADESEEAELCLIRRDDMSTKQLLKALAGEDRVLFAEPNYTFQIDGDLSEVQAAQSTVKEQGEEDSAPITEAILADDMSFLQWGNTEEAEMSFMEKTEDISMKIPGFGPTGSNMDGDPVTVAILDTAVDFTHPDLMKTAYTFTDEEQEKLGCDVHGFNATWQSEDGRLEYFEGEDHGTHCAGIMGASWDGHGISGVASNIRIISIQNCNADGRTSLINNLRGYAFVKQVNEETGADIRITSNSWGIVQFSRALEAATRELGEDEGIISVFAAGNDSSDLSMVLYENSAMINNPYRIVVSSTGLLANISSFSSYSDVIVDLGAPGENIMSCSLTGKTTYIPGMVKASDKTFEGFEEGDPNVGLALVDSDGKIIDEGRVSGREGIVFAGSHAGCLDVSKTGTMDNSIRMDFGDLASQGVEAGDYLGFCFVFDGASDGYAIIDDAQYISEQTQEKKSLEFINDDTAVWTYTFGITGIEIPDDIDLSDFQITLNTQNYKAEKLYLDNIGIGTARIPYTLKSGTSMACPAVAGAAAVLASHYPEAKGADLTEIVRSSVRSFKALEGKVKCGGIMDLSTDISGEPSPVIMELTAEDREISLKGTGFGDTRGTVTLTGVTAAGQPAEVTASITSWSDSEVKLSLREDFQGILKAVLKAESSGKYDTFSKLISLTGENFAEDLSLNKETGEPFIIDSPGDGETRGPLAAIDGKLYYLPAVTKVEEMPAHRDLFCYDMESDAWTGLASMPAWLEKPSAGVSGGKIYVKGTVMETDETGQIPVSPAEDEGREAVCCYDPAGDSWEEVSADGVSRNMSLAADDDQLYLAGNEGAGDEGAGDEGVWLYDPEKGAADRLAQLSLQMDQPSVTIRNGILYRYDATSYSIETVELKEGAVSTILKDALPETYQPPLDDTLAFSSREGSLAASDDGVFLVGPPAKDGSADTYCMSEGSTRFMPCPRRVSNGKILNLAVTVADDRLYVIGSCWAEEGGRFFRADLIKLLAPPKMTSITKLKKGKRSFTVKWKKAAAPAEGYQVRYSLKKDFGSAKKKNVAKLSKTKLTVKKLKKNKRYFVQVRTYKRLDGKKVYSDWCKAKSVKTK